MKFVLILMFMSYGGSFGNITFYDEQACKAAYKDLQRQDGYNRLRGG